MPVLDFYCSTDAESWLGWADATFAGAKNLFRSRNPILWFPAVVLGNQALEMYLKAAIIAYGGRVDKRQLRPMDVWGHNLPDLGKKLNAQVRLPTELTHGLQVFYDYSAEVRYPRILVNAGGIGKAEGKLLERLVQILRPIAAVLRANG